MLKIDAEGAEHLILSGIGRAVKTVRLLFVEFHHGLLESEELTLYKFIQKTKSLTGLSPSLVDTAMRTSTIAFSSQLSPPKTGDIVVKPAVE